MEDRFDGSRSSSDNLERVDLDEFSVPDEAEATFDPAESETPDPMKISTAIPASGSARTENMIVENAAFTIAAPNFWEDGVDNRLREDGLTSQLFPVDTASNLGLSAGKSSKLGGDLQLLANVNVAFANTLSPVDYDAALRAQFPDLVIRDGKVVIDVGAEDPVATLAALEALGLENGGTFGFMVSGLLPISAISELESLDGLRFAHASQILSNVGSVTNQADAALLADETRSDFAIDGSGVNIGVLSDSFNNLNGYATDIGTFDLPVGINILDDSTVGKSDEGRAMAQIIHDIAPGAGLLFHTAFNGQADFAQGIIDLAAAGANIIVDDIFYLREPFFQDGAIAQAVDSVTAGGALYFSAAGNAGDKSYEAAFDNSGVLIDTTALHDFDPGAGVDTGFGFTIAAGTSISISFQWDQPFFSVSGGAGSQSDLEFLLFEQGTQTIVASAADFNIGGDPVEVLSYTNTTGADQLLDFGIGLFDGVAPGLMKFVIFRGNATALEYSLGASTTLGHSNATGTLAVGAAGFFNTPEFGVSPPQAESFTALGGTPILFDIAGNRLTVPIVRDNVDFTAPDGGNTTFFSNDSAADADAFPNFFGTSASAPAAAAVAALLFQVAPNATLLQIENVLEATAIDMGAAGVDALTGAGLIQADAALFALLDITDNILTGDATANTFDGRGGVDTLTGGAGNDTLIGGAGGDMLDGGDDIDTLDYSGSSGGVIVDLKNNSASGGDAEGDTIANFENVTGSDQNDILTGSDMNNELIGGAGDDILRGGIGDDLLDGGADNDTASFADATGSGVTVDLTTAGPQAVGGGLGNDTLVDIENLIGSQFSDTLTGDGGMNIINGGAGGDLLDGGDDIDTVSYAGSSSGVSVRLQGFGALAGTQYAFGGDANGDTLTGFENVTGSSQNDDLLGSSGNNTLDGSAGEDTLNGYFGNDILIGGAGNDLLIGGVGADQMDGGADIDTVSYAGSSSGVSVRLQGFGALAGTQYAFGGDANGDTLTGFENVTGSSQNDDLLGSSGNNTLDGSAGEDTLNGYFGNDILIGGAGNDLLIGGVGADQMDGGADIDTVSYAGSSSGVSVRLQGFGALAGTQYAFGGDANGDTLTGFENATGSSQNDDLIGSAGANTLNGSAGNDKLNGFLGDDELFGGDDNDTLIGGEGNDVLNGGDGADNIYVGVNENTFFLNVNDGDNSAFGGKGNDQVFSGLGADTIDGGDDFDVVFYNASPTGVTVNLATGIASGGSAQGDTLTSIEGISGSQHDDVLTSKVVPVGLFSLIFGGGGNDIINGSAGSDSLLGLEDNDIINGGAGGDNLDGGDGIDTVSYAGSSAGVSVRLQGFGALAGTQYAFGGDAAGDTLTGFENVTGSSQNDDLLGSAGANTLDGGAGEDTLNGYFGSDVLSGGLGNDLLIGGAGGDMLDGGADIDTVSYAGSSSGVSVRLQGFGAQAGTQYAFGGDANGDTLTGFENATGSSQNDDLIGSAGANTLDGGAGEDTLNGYFGNDILIGGAGNDLLIGGTGDDLFVFAGASGSDTITDFVAGVGGEDEIDLQDSVFADYADVLANTNDDGSGNTVIAKSGVSITLNGVTKSQLDESDFILPGAAPASSPTASGTSGPNAQIISAAFESNIGYIDPEDMFLVADSHIEMGLDTGDHWFL